jgi:hypothetical protein
MALRSMSNDLWRWADPDGQQRRVRLDELRAALAGGHIAPNTPVWRAGWPMWQSAHEVPELTSSALSAANGIVPNIPPPPLAMVAVQHEFEANARGSFSPPVPTVQSSEEPPPPPRYVPLPTKANSIPPGAPSSGRLPSVGPRAPSSGATPSVPPIAPMFAPSLPTMIGLPPPPEMLALAAGQKAAANGSRGGKDPMIEELSGSMLLEDGAPHSAPHSAPQPYGAGGPGHAGAPPGYLPPPTDPIVHDQLRPSIEDGLYEGAGLPARRPQLTAIFDDLKEMKAGRPPKNKLLVAVVGILAFSVLISMLALVVSLFRGKPSEPSSDGTTSSKGSAATAGAGSAATTAKATATSTATAIVPPPTPNAVATAETTKAPSNDGALGDCALAGEAHVVSPRAFVQAGVEAVTVPGAIAIGFALDPRNGQAVTVDPASIGITTTVKARAFGGDARRMTPVLERGKLALVPGVDKKFDRLQGRRIVGTNPPIDVGIAENSVVWAPRDQNTYAKLFALDGDGPGAPVDGVRAVPLPSNARGIAVAFRRGKDLYVGSAKGDSALTADGTLAHITSLGQVGSPSIAISGDSIIVAWSDRATAQDPWQVRWTKLPIGGAAEPPKQLTLPEGGLGTQAMSPSVFGLGGGRFVMAWSEGTPTHQVRAITFNADGTTSGSAMALSAAGVNAGSPQVAVGPDGRGVAAFLAAKGKNYELHATPIACAAK